MHPTFRRRSGSSRPPHRGVLRFLPAMALAAVLLVPAVAHAQVLYGSMTGTVTDSTGAVMPGVTVQAVNVASHVTAATVTNSKGDFNFSNLFPGVYDVTFEISGFKTVVQKAVEVQTNAVRRVDTRLEVSGLAESVEVRAEAVPMQTDRADIHVTQTAQQVNDLPLSGSLGRNYQSLMQVVPGATIVRTEAGSGEANSTAGSPQRSISFSANGVSGWQNQTRIDGSPVQYVWLPTNTAYVPSAEAIEEVSIVTNAYTADVGMAGGANVNVVVKTGTNNYRGTGWIYDTDAALRARNAFQTTPTNPKNIVMQYGGNTGGPILKNRMFYFFNVERATQRTGQGDRRLSIAPANLRPNAAGSVVFPMPSEGGAIIYDPLSNPDPSLRTPFPNNTIPANRIDQAARYLIERLPATNVPGYVNNVTTTGNYFYNRTNYDLKLNYAGKNFTVFGRYGNSPHYINDEYALGEAGGGSAAGGSVGIGTGRTQVLGIGATYLFNSTTLLDLNFGLTHQVLGSEAPDIDTKPGSDSDKMNIPGTNGPDRMQGGLPSFQFGGTGQNFWSNLGNDGTGNPFQFRDNQYSWSASLQRQFAAHMVRGGFEILDQQINHFQPQGGAFQTVRGTFVFTGQATMLQNAPAPVDGRFNSWAAFLLGLPTGNNSAGKVEQLVNPNSIYMKTYSAYVGDSWRVNGNLTVTLGLRWEHQTWPTRPDGFGINRFDASDGYVYVGGYGSTPQNTFGTTSGDFLPRLGAAYSLNPKTVLRGGYARSVDNSSFVNFRNSYPSVYIWSLPSGKFNGVDNPYVAVTTLRQGIAPPAGSPDFSSGKILLPAGTGTTTYPKDLERPGIDSWNITLQRELKSWLTGQVAYVATRASEQFAYVNINAGAPGTGLNGRALYAAGVTNATVDINSFSPYGDLSYNGLQTQLRIRQGDVQASVMYTWSKTTNYSDNGGGNAAGAGGPRIQYLPEKERNEGTAGYDRTHNLQAFWNWALPFGAGRTWATSGWQSAVFGGWQFNGAVAIMSGTPIYVIQGTANNLNAAGSGQIPDRVKDTVATYDNLVGRPPAGADPNSYQYFDRSAYQAVNIPAGQPQRFGNSPRNTLRGPGFWNLDLGLFRDFTIVKSVRAQFRLEMLNALNHANYSNPGNNVSDANTFGFITATTGVGERNIRLGFRVWF